MDATIGSDRWTAVRASLARATDRFTEVVSGAPGPRTMATAHWTVADTAAHVGSIAWGYTTLVRATDPVLPVPALREQFDATTVETVADLNDTVMRRWFPERDPAVLVDRLRSDVDTVLRHTRDDDPARPVPWLGASRLPLAGVLAHLVNELNVHGRDVARATGAHWVVPPADSALFFDLFLVGILRHDTGCLFDNDEPPRERRIAVEFRSAHTTPVTIVLHRGRVSVEEPGARPDVRLWFDPSALSLMLFGRISRLRAIGTRGVVARGRVWLLPAFLRTVRLPS